MKKYAHIPLSRVLKYYLNAFTHKQKILYITCAVLQIIRVASFIFSPLYYKKIFDYIASSGIQGPVAFQYVLSLLGVIAIIRLVSWIAARFYVFIYSTLIPKIHHTIRLNAYQYLIRHSNTFFSNNFAGSLTQKVNKFTDAFRELSDRILNDFLNLFVKIIGVMAVLYGVNYKIGLAMCTWVIIFILVSYFLSKKRIPLSLNLSLSRTRSVAHLADSISNVSTTQLFSSNSFENKKFFDITLDVRNSWIKRNVFDSFVNGTYATFMAITELVLVGGALWLWSKGQITLGTVILLQTYIITLVDDIWGFSRIIQAFEESYSDACEMVEILETPHEVQDKTDAKELVAKEGKIVFDDVTFSYNENTEALSDLNVEIPSGQKVGLIGPSGAGKSTFVKLLLRFFDVSGGSIQIDGQDIRDVTQDSLHNAIGYVPQDPSLFHRSLMDNIRYGRRDATDEEVIVAAQKAHADEFINKLPDGYNTLVGERGIKLSGGERQRVAIARAILKNAPILVLDEATSALDSESERLIQDALNVLMEGKTVMVIAHRLSTIQHMDRILVIDDGKIVEDGTHTELLKKRKSLYKKLWQLQAGGFVE